MKKEMLILTIILLIFSFSLFAQDFEGFETGDFSAYEWNFEGDANWFVTDLLSHSGTYCAQAGDVDDNQSSTIYITKEVMSESNISFYWKVDSENNYDYLRFYIDDEEITNICGEQDWEYFETSVSPGTHTFKWSYTKDFSVSHGEDTGWIDDITFPLSITYDNDLSIISFSVPENVNIGEQLIANCTVKNVGNLPQNQFTLYLKDEEENTLVSLDITDELQPSQNQTYQLIYTIPSTQPFGAFSIYAEVFLQNDENLNNNTSEHQIVHILPEGVSLFDIGDGNENSNKTPIDFWYKSSITEVLYYPDELPPSGSLVSIKYYHNFPNPLTNQPINIWVGETDLEGLDDGWISAPELQQVFSGNLDFEAGSSSIEILLDNPYEYSGAHNLIILVERPLDSQYYSSSDYFICTNVGEHASRSRSYYSDSTPLDPQDLNNDAGSILDVFPNTTLGFIVGGMGNIEGVVYNDQSQPLENALVEILGIGRTTYTLADGSFSFVNVYPGTYSLQASYEGYNPQVVDSVEVVEEDTTYVQFNLVPLSTASIFGHVVGSDAPDTPLEGAQVNLTGFENYSTTTNENGDFIFESVYCGHTYHITVTYEGYSQYSSDIEFGDTPMDLGTIILNEIAYPPANVMAEQNADQTVATVYWTNSGSFSGEFRYDDGTMVGQIGSAATPPNAAFGAKFIQSAMINEIRWYLTSEYTTHNSVKLYIFALDASHLPTSTILFQSGSIQNTDDEWNSYVLDTPVEADNGFLVAISTPNIFTGLGYDDGVGAPWEFVQNTQYATEDYTTGNWSAIENFGFYNNLMIRAYGYVIGKKDRSLEAYKIYRFNVEDQENQELWDVVAENVSVQDTMYVDSTYAQLPIGTYRYAVSSIYTNNVESSPTLSNLLVKTNVGNNPSEMLPILNNVSQNYPNPFIISTKKKIYTYFDISIKENETGNLYIYNLKGQLVKSFNNISSGYHKISWDGTNLSGKKVSSGIYLYKLKTKSSQLVKKMIILSH